MLRSKLFTLMPSFKTLLQEINQREARRADRYLILHRGQGDLVECHLSCSSMFCRSLVTCGYLTQQQMEHASSRYRLGMSRDGGVIFWQISRSGTVYDGKIMYYRPDCHRDHHRHPTWVSAELKRFYLSPDDELNEVIQPAHSLFGLHLLQAAGQEGSAEHSEEKRDKTVAVVESEKTAVICSELFPDYFWMATGGLSELSASKLLSLRGRKIILFPDTDPEGTAYRTWYQVAHEAEWLLGHPVTVSPLLEQHATPTQKAAKIDLVDFLSQGSEARPQKSSHS